MLAAGNGNSPVVQYLISKESKVDLEADNGSTSLSYAAQGGELEVLKLLATNENIDCINVKGKTPLMYAVEEEKVEAVQFLLSAGADATKADKEQNTCLHLAAETAAASTWCVCSQSARKLF
jgi:uncharacterized protein